MFPLDRLPALQYVTATMFLDTNHIRHALVFCALLLAGDLQAEPLTIAVASNFVVPAREIVKAYSETSGHAARISSGSTGKLYAQIVNGAPFDVFLAADAARPAQLEQDGLGVPGSRFTYAIGALTLWSADARLSDEGCLQALQNLGDRRLAIANPKTAPYGRAAEEFLRGEQLWDSVAPQLVYGENISQVLHFVATGNASLGLIAASQAVDSRLPEASCRWPVPASSHAPLEQQAILLRAGPEADAGRGFLEYLQGAASRAAIEAHGYTVPP